MILEKQVHDLEVKLRKAEERIKFLEAWRKGIDNFIKGINSIK